MESNRIKNQFKLGEAFRYFFRVFGKKDPSRPDSFNLRMMHGINRISIIMFLFCLVVMLVRALTR
ncbi:DUF6728 family protein [Siphonobacter curvatus]|uniref:DUF2970 domain-containing protein n=1 Tax=Siphonobacter curvatus TaxID=2094562 RepID=A0A2S7IQA9_9BACT|nr:DUF6728 family protein [Siphonobacter curvatus]PQA59872.1 hypothetical protein C5O19_09685 [Siphonobacter curvatus]